MITSFKGGVGKSTITANLALSLAKCQKRTLALDCDFNMRCLDLIMGLEDRVIYDVCDVVTQRVPPEKAVIRDERSENLFFLAAPYTFHDTIEPAAFCNTVKALEEAYDLDYILLDTPGDNGFPHALACAAADMAFVIATHQPTSIRAAERTAEQLQKAGIRNRRLIINHFDFAAVRRGIRPGVTDIIDRTSIQLIGVVPYDTDFSRLQEHGALIDTLRDSPACVALANITSRIINPSANVPLFSGLGRTERRIARM